MSEVVKRRKIDSVKNLEYEDYNTTSKVYDSTRVAVGADTVINLFKGFDHVLDGGCGTGNYAVQIAPHVKKLTGFEYNSGMKEQCEAKVAALGLKNVEIKAGSLLEKLPFADNTFDGIMVNQVLHHLDQGGEDGSYPNIARLLAEFHRVLKPNGKLCINNTTSEQGYGFWWFNLFPKERQDPYLKRHMSRDTTLSLYKNAGFSVEEIIVKDPLMGPAYFNLGGLFQAKWRMTDSTWAIIPEEDIPAMEKEWQKLADEGKLGAKFDELDEPRRVLGQSTFFVGTKQ